MFVPEADGVVVATMLTQGPWDPNSQYGGTPAALLTWAVEGVPTLVPMRIARITVDMHRRVPLGRLVVHTDVVREGKRLQVVVATICDPDGTEVARATALRFRLGHGPDAPTDPSLPPIATPPLGAPRSPGPRSGDLNGFIDATEMRDGGCTGRGDDLVPGDQAGHRGRSTVTDGTARLGIRLHRELGELPRAHALVGDQRRSHHQPEPRAAGGVDRGRHRAPGIRSTASVTRAADLFDRDGFVGTCTASLLVDEIAAPY